MERGCAYSKYEWSETEIPGRQPIMSVQEAIQTQVGNVGNILATVGRALENESNRSLKKSALLQAFLKRKELDRSMLALLPEERRANVRETYENQYGSTDGPNFDHWALNGGVKAFTEWLARPTAEIPEGPTKMASENMPKIAAVDEVVEEPTVDTDAVTLAGAQESQPPGFILTLDSGNKTYVPVRRLGETAPDDVDTSSIEPAEMLFESFSVDREADGLPLANYWAAAKLDEMSQAQAQANYKGFVDWYDQYGGSIDDGRIVRNMANILIRGGGRNVRALVRQQLPGALDAKAIKSNRDKTVDASFGTIPPSMGKNRFKNNVWSQRSLSYDPKLPYQSSMTLYHWGDKDDPWQTERPSYGHGVDEYVEATFSKGVKYQQSGRAVYIASCGKKDSKTVKLEKPQQMRIAQGTTGGNYLYTGLFGPDLYVDHDNRIPHPSNFSSPQDVIDRFIDAFQRMMPPMWISPDRLPSPGMIERIRRLVSLLPVSNVLRNAVQGRRQERSTQWRKPGGFTQAERDFDSLNLSNVRDHPNGVRSGRLPDGTEVVVRPRSRQGLPTLEFQIREDGSVGWRGKVRYDP